MLSAPCGPAFVRMPAGLPNRDDNSTTVWHGARSQGRRTTKRGIWVTLLLRPVVPLLRELHTVSPTSKIIVIGAEKTLACDTLDGLRALPAVAYVVWEDLCDEALMLCLRVAFMTNLLLTSPAVAKVAAAPTRTGELAVRTILTKREQEVFRLAGSGATYEDIAARLYIRKSTLKTHVAHIRRKLELSPREELGAAYRRLMQG